MNENIKNIKRSLDELYESSEKLREKIKTTLDSITDLEEDIDVLHQMENMSPDHFVADADKLGKINEKVVRYEEEISRMIRDCLESIKKSNKALEELQGE